MPLTPVIQAKFHCLRTVLSYDDHHQAHLLPVCGKEIFYDTDGVRREVSSDENKWFWSATPSGKAEVAFGKRALNPSKWEPYPTTFELGAYYYVWFVPLKGVYSEEEVADLFEPDDLTKLRGPWEKWSTSNIRLANTSLHISFERYKGQGSLEMTVENAGAIPLLLNPFLEQYQRHLLTEPPPTPDWSYRGANSWAIAFVKVDPGTLPEVTETLPAVL